MMIDQGTSQSFGTIINSGGEDLAFYNSVGGTHNAVVNSGGTQVAQGAIVYSTTVNAGGVLSVTAANPVEILLVSGMSVGTMIGSGGVEVVAGGPGANGVAGQAITYGTVVFAGGQEKVHAGSTARGTIVDAGGRITNDATADGTILNGGTMWDNAGGTANGTTVLNGGNEIVYGGSVANNTIVAARGIETINQGFAYGTQVQMGGFEGPVLAGTPPEWFGQPQGSLRDNDSPRPLPCRSDHPTALRGVR
jgi:fibronectin-binding autotransporter adhesin